MTAAAKPTTLQILYITLPRRQKFGIITLLPWDVLMEVPTEEHCREYF